jgi:hypothetical protein
VREDSVILFVMGIQKLQNLSKPSKPYILMVVCGRGVKATGLKAEING